MFTPLEAVRAVWLSGVLETVYAGGSAPFPTPILLEFDCWEGECPTVFFFLALDPPDGMAIKWNGPGMTKSGHPALIVPVFFGVLDEINFELSRPELLLPHGARSGRLVVER